MNRGNDQRGTVTDLIALFLLTLVVRMLTALPQQQPHYFDAYFYYDVAENLSLGRGFVVDFIWNYLQAPDAVTHPSNLYWMPLSSIITYFPFAVLGVSYRAAQIPFVLLSSVPPLLAYYLSHRIYRSRRDALLAGLLTAFAPFYLKYWSCPDNFAPFAVAGTLSLMTMFLGWSTRQARYFLATGLFIGLGHLSRADGFLLWIAFLALLALIWLRSRRAADDGGAPDSEPAPPVRFKTCVLWLGLAVVGYLAVMAPWLYRNWKLIGAPLSSAGAETVFARSYADLFSYSKELTWQSYLAWGWREILRSKLSAGIHNLAVVLGALQFHLAPLAIIGLWQLRRRKEYIPFYLYATTLYVAMTVIFTFPSTHASMLHSVGALLPFLFVAAIPGTDTAVDWVSRRRRTWHPGTAKTVFRVGLTVVVAVISLFDYCQSVFLSLNPLSVQPLWNRANTGYLTVSDWLASEGSKDAIVMVVDPPAYFYFTHSPAIVTPHETVEGILEVAKRYEADYLIVERDHVEALDPLYHGETTHSALELRRSFRDANGDLVQIYAVRR